MDSVKNLFPMLESTIITIITVVTAFLALVGTYIKLRIDKSNLDLKISEVDEKVDEKVNLVNLQLTARICKQQDSLLHHEKLSDAKFDEIRRDLEDSRKENREDHQVLFTKIDGLKDYLMNGKTK